MKVFASHVNVNVRQRASNKKQALNTKLTK